MFISPAGPSKCLFLQLGCTIPSRTCAGRTLSKDFAHVVHLIFFGGGGGKWGAVVKVSTGTVVILVKD